MTEGEGEGEPFEPGCGFIFDELGLVERLDAGGEPRGGAEALGGGRGGEVFDGVDVEVEEVAVKDGCRQVGAGVVGLAVEDGVEGVEGDVASAGVVCDPVDDAAEGGEITASPGAGGVDAVEADSEAGEFTAGFKGGAEVGAAGADDEPGFGAEGSGLDLKRVVAERGRRIEGEGALGGGVAPGGDGEGGPFGLPLAALTVFEVEREVEQRGGGASGVQGDGDGVPFDDGGEGSEAGLGFGFGSESGENAAGDLGGEFVAAAEDVPVFALNAEAGGRGEQRFAVAGDGAGLLRALLHDKLPH